jgi:hypothetical protein
MSPRFGRPSAYTPPSPADDATPGAVESLDAFLALTPLQALAADAARCADDTGVGPAAGDDAAHPTSPTPASTTASADWPPFRSTPASAGNAAPGARFQGAPQAAPPETRAEGRLMHHLRRDR